jgi:transcriptional regulator with PAS, ATPase and Fis domain
MVILMTLNTNLALGILCLFVFALLVFLYRLNISHKAIKHELFLKNECLDTIMMSMEDCLIAIDFIGMVRQINKSAESITRCVKQEVIGNHIDTVFKVINEKTGLKQVNPAIESILKNKNVQLSDYNFLKINDGTKLFVNYISSQLCNEVGDIIVAILVFREVFAKNNDLVNQDDLYPLFENGAKGTIIETVESETRYPQLLT